MLLKYGVVGKEGGVMQQKLSTADQELVGDLQERLKRVVGKAPEEEQPDALVRFEEWRESLLVRQVFGGAYG